MSDRDIRICFVGDSFVNGTGDPEYLGWTGRTCITTARAGYAVTYYNLGIRGNTNTDVRVRWLQESERRLPPRFDGRIVFSFGVNDTAVEEGKQRLNTAQTWEHTKFILAEARSRFPILLVSPPPVANQENNQRIINSAMG